MTEYDSGSVRFQEPGSLDSRNGRNLSSSFALNNAEHDTTSENDLASDLKNGDIGDHSREIPLIQTEVTGAEDIAGYTKGGYHPVHLGDEFQNGRYRVLHKLGSGGFSTVWLSRDRQTNLLVALKIMVAKASNENEPNEVKVWKHLKDQKVRNVALKHFCILSNSFHIDGPNGRHACLVYPVTGPNLGSLFDANVRLRGSVVRNIARQLTEAVALLHSNGLCHGDLTSSNLTLKLLNFESWTDIEVKERLEEPKIELLRTGTGDSRQGCRPRYIVQPVDMYRVNSDFQTQELCLIDFNEAFFVNEPPKEIGTPRTLPFPVTLVWGTPGITSDLWALGCTFFCLRVGLDLVFDAFVSMGAFASLETIIDYLGPLPDRWDKLYIDDYGVPKASE